MLSLAKIGRGREDYHLRAVGADASAYYSEQGEVAGRCPDGDAQPVAPPRACQRMPGIDACFKAPKSVSLPSVKLLGE